MSDIVERLRGWISPRQTHILNREAADEIENLRYNIDFSLAVANKRADEIERLRTALQKIAAIEDDAWEDNWAEIEMAREIAHQALNGTR
jgi:regulator of replication initiation timing